LGFEDFVEPYECATFEQFEAILSTLHSKFARLVFRGHSDHEWSLSSSLERFILEIAPPNAKLDRSGRAKAIANRFGPSEDILLNDFKRGAHLHSNEVIDQNDRLGWLALVQHHGTPIRLLDWTLSPYIAQYFAI
jgi:hypothetical protein